MIPPVLGHVLFPSPPLSAASYPLLLPGKPAVLLSLPLALAGAPWPQHRGLPPLPSFSTSVGALAVPLSQQIADPHCEQGLISARPGAICEWTEGRHPQAARKFLAGRDVPQCLGVTRVSFRLAVNVWGPPEKRFE